MSIKQIVSDIEVIHNIRYSHTLDNNIAVMSNSHNVNIDSILKYSIFEHITYNTNNILIHINKDLIDLKG